MEKWEKAALAIFLVIALCIALYTFTPIGRAIGNWRAYQVQKVNDATSYKTKKEVEDTCRAMISSYESDRLTYEQYKDSDNSEKQGWAEQAKMRANKTAIEYNNYVLKNNYIWKGNIPKDIRSELEYLT